MSVLHVIQEVRSVPAAELRDFYQRLTRVSTRRLERVARRFASRGVRVGTVVCVGEPAREIVGIAAKQKIDLIVMGSHKVAPGRLATGWGTMGYKVGILCRCPVLLVK